MNPKQAKRLLGPNPAPENNGHEIHSDFLMKNNRVAELRAEASPNSRPDSKRSLKATIKLQQETMKTQIQQIETLDKTSHEQNATIETQKRLLASTRIGYPADHGDRYKQPLLGNPVEVGPIFGHPKPRSLIEGGPIFGHPTPENLIEGGPIFGNPSLKNPFKNGSIFGNPFSTSPFGGGTSFNMASENPLAGGQSFETTCKDCGGIHKDRPNHLAKEPNVQPVAQSIFGPPLQERPVQLTKGPNCSNCRIMETQRMEDKTLIQRLRSQIAQLEAAKEPEVLGDSYIDETEIPWLSRILENNHAELRDSYEAASKAIFEGQQQEDRGTIARLQSRNADLEATIEQNDRGDIRMSEVLGRLTERLDRIVEKLDTIPVQVIRGPHVDPAARLQDKMGKLDAALGQLSAAEDEDAKKPTALIDSEQVNTTVKGKEGRCIVS